MQSGSSSLHRSNLIAGGGSLCNPVNVFRKLPEHFPYFPNTIAATLADWAASLV